MNKSMVLANADSTDTTLVSNSSVLTTCKAKMLKACLVFQELLLRHDTHFLTVYKLTVYKTDSGVLGRECLRADALILPVECTWSTWWPAWCMKRSRCTRAMSWHVGLRQWVRWVGTTISHQAAQCTVSTTSDHQTTTTATISFTKLLYISIDGVTASRKKTSKIANQRS